MKFIELNRRFRNITEEELGNPELLFSFGESFLHSTTDDWTKLLESRRVVLLAEAGSGKTEEMRKQASKLKYAFYADLASLDRESLSDLLSADEERAFTAWKTEHNSPAWFFLDSVDELKLTQGKLKRAINRFAKDVQGLLHRAYVIISCRPSDWKFDLDLETVKNTLPIHYSRATPIDLTGEALFLAPLRRDDEKQKEDSDKKTDEVRTVIMMPLTPDQIETYARSCGVQDTEAFMEEIRQQEAWLFANRPLDCENLIRIWNDRKELGTRSQQHEANIAAKIKDDPDRADNNLLSNDNAREGAERLALALALTRTRTILAPGHESSEGVLDSAAILTDWTDAKRNALLRRGLFDPATYGRIRFHHRSVEEYLAAYRFNRLREKGMSINALKRFFFAEQYGAEVVIPSMRPIAAWLALWNDDIRRELIRREPEVLLAYGDPGELSIEDRSELLRAFAAAYGEGGWRGISISIGEIRRLAHPALAPVIRELWGEYSASEEVGNLLLEIIWQGAIEDCVDIAEEVAWDMQRSEHQRQLGIFCLVACKQAATLRYIAESILDEQDKWSDKIVPELAQQLFPAALSVQELVVLIERMPQPESETSTSGFAWYFERIARDIDPSSGTATELRNAIANLIWQGRDSRQEFWNITGKYSYLSSGLAILCGKQLTTELPDDDLVWACAVANRFGTRLKDREKSSFQGLKYHFKNHPLLRKKAFWIEVELIGSLFSDESDILKSIAVTSLTGQQSLPLQLEDRFWLLETLKNRSAVIKKRKIACHFIVQLWNWNGRLDDEAEKLMQAVADDTSLSEQVEKAMAPALPNPEEEKLKRRARRQECVHQGRERQRIDNWKKRREEIVDEPNVAFSLQRLSATVENIAEWLSYFHAFTQDVKNKGISAHSDLEVIAKAFDPETASRLIKAFWNNPPEDSCDSDRGWRYQLFSITEEETATKWVEALYSETAKKAARYAVDCLYGFPHWFIELAKAHSDVILCVLGDELDQEFATVSHNSFSHILYYLSHADKFIKQLFSPRLCVILLKWDSIHGEGDARWSVEHLDRIVGILYETAETKKRTGLAAKCAEQFSRSPNGSLALPWLRGLFRFDPEQGTEVLEQGLNTVEECERADLAERLFAGLFDKNLSSVLPCFSAIEEQVAKVNVLKRLLLLSYTFIHPEQDNIYDGAYSPDVRDDAASARSSLLSALLDSSGAEAHKIILELADNSLFAHFSDRLRQLAREQAAKDAEFAPYEPAALVTLEKKFEAPPRSRDELFEVMMDRLEVIQHDIAYHDFNIRQTLRTITAEEEMQRYLAKEFDANRNGAYTVARENEKADKKRTDIELTAVHGEQKAVIEIKLAIKIKGNSRWSIADFQRALRHQLVGQYLRHETCKAGCLLLTCNGSKKFWQHPETKKRVYFPELIKLLQAEAETIEQEKNHEIRLAVFALDLTDPHLEPAHGSLRQLEDQMDIEDAEKALADPEGNIPAQEVWKKLGL